MLIVGREVGESIRVDTGHGVVTFTLTKIQGKRRVEIGIDAPREMTIRRVTAQDAASAGIEIARAAS